MSRPLEHDYMGGLSELPSLPMRAGVEKSDLQKNHPTPTPVKPSSASAHPSERRSKDLDLNLNLTLEATELRLGLPGSDPPERDAADESAVVDGRVLKNFAVAGAKRGFSDAIDLRSEKWVLANDVGSESAGGGKAGCSGVGNGGLFSPKAVGGRGEALNGSVSGNRPATPKDVVTETEKKAQSSAHASKAQVVGWPPIRSFRKNTMASSKNTEKVEPNLDAGCLYVKVSMDGAPYLRKIDLKIYSSYAELSGALEKMFSGFTIGKYGYHGVPGRDGLSESRLMDLLRCSEYVLTYEDKDGDWMLVGDVPWVMFASLCRKLRITMSSEAIGLAPRAKDKCKSQD